MSYNTDMNYEMDSTLRIKAENFLKTESKLVGEKWLDSKLRKIMHVGVTAITSPVWGSIAGAEAGLVYLGDGKYPFVDLGLRKDEFLQKDVHWFKVRTMIPDARETEAEYVGNNELSRIKASVPDPRITSVGKIIRWTHFDDLTLLTNVMLMDISLAGSRIPAITEWQQITANSESEPFKSYIESVKSGNRFGIAGMFTVFRQEASQSLANRVALDTLWLKKVSLNSELKTIFKTFANLRKPTG